MAKIGLKYIKYATFKSENEEKVTYNEPKHFGKPIDCNVSIECNDASLYAGDGQAETDNSFNSGTIKLGVDEISDEVFSELLGHKLNIKKSQSGGELIRNSGDRAPYVGVGRVLPKMVNGVKLFKVEFLYKVKFKEPSQEEKTKGEKLDFVTYSIEGKIHLPENGNWSKTETFKDLAAARAYLDSCFK